MNHVTEEQLILHYYLESEDEVAIESHLSACESCRSALQEIQRTLALVDGAPIPEPPQDYGSLVWERIRPHLGRKARIGWEILVRPPGWALAAALGALLIAAFLAGRYWPRPEETIAHPSASDVVGKRVLLASAAEHLERCQFLLTDLIHAGEGGEDDISGIQAMAQDLLESNRIYRQTAKRAGEPILAGVLDDVERTLLEIAHSPARADAAELTMLQREIAREGILFKIRVTTSRVRERQNAAIRELARRVT